jgi:hypothetical protein
VLYEGREIVVHEDCYCHPKTWWTGSTAEGSSASRSKDTKWRPTSLCRGVSRIFPGRTSSLVRGVSDGVDDLEDSRSESMTSLRDMMCGVSVVWGDIPTASPQGFTSSFVCRGGAPKSFSMSDIVWGGSSGGQRKTWTRLRKTTHLIWPRDYGVIHQSSDGLVRCAVDAMNFEYDGVQRAKLLLWNLEEG